MNELDEEFELSPGEKIRSLTIWLTPMGFSTECPGLEVGQVAAIHFETTRARVVTFYSPDFESLPPQKLHHQYQCDYDEEMTAVSWILNLATDRVRAVVSPNSGASQEALIMVPEQQPPFDLVQKLYFKTRDEEGWKETIVTAEAYFRNGAIIGLAFVYESGTRASIGDLGTEVRQSIHFAQDDCIVGLSVAITESEVTEFEFDVEPTTQPRHKTLRLFVESPHDQVNAAGYDMRDVWCKDTASAKSCQRHFEHDRVYKPPHASKLVGIYIGCQEFSHDGVLYEPNVV